MPASALLESLVALTVLLSTLGHGVTAFTRWRDATGELLAATRDQAAEEHQPVSEARLTEERLRAAGA